MNRSEAELPSVLVVGATGNQGGAVAHSLLESTDYDVNILTRSPGSVAAQRLSEQGATIRQGDLSDLQSLEDALDGVDRAFYITDHLSAEDTEAERRQGYNVIEAAVDQGVNHLVYSSTVDADIATDVPHFASKNDIETRLRESEMAGTVLRPSPFYQNFEQFGKPIRAGFLPFPMDTDAALPMVDVQDIGAAALEVLTNPGDHVGKTHNVCAGLYTMEEIATIIASFTSVKTTAISVPTTVVRLKEDRSIARMFEWFSEYGRSRQKPETQLDIDFTTFEAYLQGSQLLDGGPIGPLIGRLTTPFR